MLVELSVPLAETFPNEVGIFLCSREGKVLLQPYFEQADYGRCPVDDAFNAVGGFNSRAGLTILDLGCEGKCERGL